MKLKKILAGALAAVMAVGSLSVGAFAEEEALVSGDYQYEVLENGTVSITQYLGEDENVVIPNAIDDRDVTVIGERAFSGAKVVTVKIPGTVRTIEANAFLSCESLTDVVIPNSVTTIGSHAFNRCYSLTEATVPINVSVLESGVFRNCTSLTKVVLPTGLTSIGGLAFGNCGALVDVEIPDTVTYIDKQAFFECGSLTEVVIPDSVTYIDNLAFSCCTSLTEVVISSRVEYMGVNVFALCPALESLTILARDIEIENNDLFGDYGIPENLTIYGYGGSVAEEIALEYGVRFVDLDTIIDGLPEGELKIDISIEVVSETQAVIKIINVGGEDFEPDGSVTVTVAIPEELRDADKYYIYYQAEDGTLEEMEEVTLGYSENKDVDIISFTTDHFFGTYILSTVELTDDKPEETTTPSTTEPEQLVGEDKDTGVQLFAAEGVLPEGVDLNVKIGTADITTDAHVYVLDITLVNAQGETVQPDGSVTVRIPLPEDFEESDTYYVFYQAEDGTLTDMKATFKDGVITFTTTHFSTYIVSAANLLADNKGDSPNTGIEGVAIFAGLAIVAAAGVVISKKRR